MAKYVSEKLQQARYALAMLDFQPTQNAKEALEQGRSQAAKIGKELGLSPSDQFSLVNDAQNISLAGLRNPSDAVGKAAHGLLASVAKELKTSIPELRQRFGQGLMKKLAQLEASAPGEVVEASFHIEGADERLQAALGRLDRKIGLEDVKARVARWAEEMTYNKMRESLGKKALDKLNHAIFRGPPGVGKTSVAECIGELAHGLGLIDSSKVTKAKYQDLCGEYRGHTAPKTEALFKEALGGVLFVDEVQTLFEEKGEGFGREALQTLLTLMVEHKDDIIVIFGGYPESIDKLKSMDRGLSRRIGHTLDFHEFSTNELEAIFLNLCEDFEVEVTDEAIDAARDVFDRVIREDDFGNAGFVVDQCFPEWTGNLASRLVGDSNQADRLEAHDITVPEGFRLEAAQTPLAKVQTVQQVVDKLSEGVVGQIPAKEALGQALVIRSGMSLDTPLSRKPVGFHVFAGPSGVGKTQLAKQLAKDFYDGNLIQISGNELGKGEVETMLRGAAPKYVGHDNPTNLLAQPLQECGQKAVVLIDEVEKADPAIWKFLMQVADEGFFYDGKGQKIDCRNVQFVLNSNIGNKEKVFELDFNEASEKVQKLLREIIPDEIYGRLSEDPTVFHHLDQEMQSEIFDNNLQSLIGAELNQMGLSIESTPEAAQILVDKGFDPSLGNRPLQRLLQKEVFLPIIEAKNLEPENYPKGTKITLEKGPGDSLKLTPHPPEDKKAQDKRNSEATKALEGDRALLKTLRQFGQMNRSALELLEEAGGQRLEGEPAERAEAVWKDFQESGIELMLSAAQDLPKETQEFAKLFFSQNAILDGLPSESKMHWMAFANEALEFLNKSNPTGDALWGAWSVAEARLNDQEFKEAFESMLHLEIDRQPPADKLDTLSEILRQGGERLLSNEQVAQMVLKAVTTGVRGKDAGVKKALGKLESAVLEQPQFLEALAEQHKEGDLEIKKGAQGWVRDQIAAMGPDKSEAATALRFAFSSKADLKKALVELLSGLPEDSNATFTEAQSQTLLGIFKAVEKDEKRFCALLGKDVEHLELDIDFDASRDGMVRAEGDLAKNYSGFFLHTKPDGELVGISRANLEAGQDVNREVYEDRDLRIYELSVHLIAALPEKDMALLPKSDDWFDSIPSRQYKFPRDPDYNY